MSYKRFPKSDDLSRNKINWNKNTCIQLIGIVILVVFIILLELHIRRLSIHSGLAIGLRPEMLVVGGFSATQSAK
jgi:hypothetical protein